MSQINESAIKTPGVYVNEIPSFPPSVAQVSTAIPVFIGYTEKAIDAAGSSLTNKPTKIFSLLEYIQYYGKAFNETDSNVAVTKTTAGGVVTSVSAAIKLAGARSNGIVMLHPVVMSDTATRQAPFRDLIVAPYTP